MVDITMHLETIKIIMPPLYVKISWACLRSIEFPDPLETIVPHESKQSPNHVQPAFNNLYTIPILPLGCLQRWASFWTECRLVSCNLTDIPTNDCNSVTNLGVLR